MAGIRKLHTGGTPTPIKRQKHNLPVIFQIVIFESPAHFEEVRQVLSIYIHTFVSMFVVVVVLLLPKRRIGNDRTIELKFPLNTLPHPGFNVCFGEVDP